MRLFVPNVKKMLIKKNVSGLIKALSDKDRDICLEAERALLELGKSSDTKVVDLLIAALSSSIENVRKSSVQILGQIHNIKSVEPLIVMLQDSDQWVRFSASLALTHFDDPRIVKPLIDALLEDRGHISCSFLEDFCLDRLPTVGKHLTLEILSPVLKIKDSEVFTEVVRALGKLNDKRAGEVIIAALMERTSDEFKEMNDCKKIAESLVNLSTYRLPNNIPLLIQICFAIKRHDWNLVTSFGEQSVRPLIECLYDNDFEVSANSAEILGKLGDRKAIEPLALRYKSSCQTGNFAVSNACYLALRNFGIQMM
jgi:HEAT repeat protein